ncbi:cytochrome b/b6 domain-containing protein [Sphingomonas sp. LB-2]|uniref:cytochrome b/b6 domain-containing protein n=1 Tax=Sphingomonas caeni TaxID=2984949 RepID=UPI00222EB583|nr:cytochrome b/b6 domain-containing protein [Sphingomonas caeni]MCW3848039.1 cytochrome b/b6 domain-containing protein [Sphingomonas caeni]
MIRLKRAAGIARPAPIHPLLVRIAHWINAIAMVVMVMSGWAIHNAHPIAPFLFPESVTLGGGLIGALQWHFAAMWVLGINGLIYLVYGFASGRFARKLRPISLRSAFDDTLAALRGRLGHEDLSRYNGVQRLLYAGVIALGVLVVASGMAIWKPVQFPLLRILFGDFDNARIVHFTAMTGIFLFTLIHVAMALLVPKSLRAMIRGY